MHQYHLGNTEEEKDGELVVSKVFYQTQPRQCGSTNKEDHPMIIDHDKPSDSYNQGLNNRNGLVEFNYDASLLNPAHYTYYNQHDETGLISSFPTQLIPNFADPL